MYPEISHQAWYSFYIQLNLQPNLRHIKKQPILTTSCSPTVGVIVLPSGLGQFGSTDGATQYTASSEHHQRNYILSARHQCCSTTATATTAITTTTIVIWPFVWNYPGEPVPEETFANSHLSWSSIILYLLPPSTMIHSILPVQFMRLTVFLNSLSPSPLWYTSWPGTVHFILHTFLHPIIVFSLWPVWLQYQDYVT